MAFVLHLLRPSDHVLDIGSNVGTYSVLAAAAIGARALLPSPFLKPSLGCARTSP